jgi:uncharacterized protein with von Willebrand factor type A (vWA) domain
VSAVDLAGGRIVAHLVRFGRLLRDAGMEIGPSRIQDALQALTVVDIGSSAQVYWALRCTLVSRPGDIEIFDQAFAGSFGDSSPTRAGRAPDAVDRHRDRVPGAPPSHRAGESGEEIAPGDHERSERAAESAGMQFSAVERLRELDFSQYSDGELRRAARLVQRIAAAVPVRRSRRLRDAGEGAIFDKRGTLRRAMRTDGYPVALRWRAPRSVQRKLLFALDVSGSMEPYARAMMMFAQAAVRAGRRVEVFTFGTRLTRVTGALRSSSPDHALAATTLIVPDWAGGTRIGANLRALNDDWGRRGLTRGAVAVIASDGWERGDISSLVREMQRLRNTAHTIVWVNPVAGEPGYEPLAQGMAASLPYVDHFLPGHNLRSLEALAEVLESLPSARPRRSAAQRPR